MAVRCLPCHALLRLAVVQTVLMIAVLAMVSATLPCEPGSATANCFHAVCKSGKAAGHDISGRSRLPGGSATPLIYSLLLMQTTYNRAPDADEMVVDPHCAGGAWALRGAACLWKTALQES